MQQVPTFFGEFTAIYALYHPRNLYGHSFGSARLGAWDSPDHKHKYRNRSRGYQDGNNLNECPGPPQFSSSRPFERGEGAEVTNG